MTKRVVLIGHPVAHSLSGAMQQAAFDDQGIDATYELWDRAPIVLPDAIAEIRGDDFLGANVTIPHKERVVPLVDKLTEEAQATGAVEHDHARRPAGSSATTPTCRASRSPSTSSSAARRCRAPRSSSAPAAASRAVVYGLIREGFQRVVVFNRHLHRAEALVKHFGRSASHMELRAMPWHESIIEAELAQDEDPRERDLDRADRRRLADPGRDPAAGAAGARPDLQPDAPPARRGGGRGDRGRRRADAPPPGRGRVHPLDGPAGTGRRDAEGAVDRPRRGVRSAEGEPTGEPEPTAAGAGSASGRPGGG